MNSIQCRFGIIVKDKDTSLAFVVRRMVALRVVRAANLGEFMRVFLIVLALAAASAPAVAGLSKTSRGHDWVAASLEDQAAWASHVARILSSGSTGAQVTAKDLAQCLDGALNVTNHSDEPGADMLRGNSLAELSALCATGLQGSSGKR